MKKTSTFISQFSKIGLLLLCLISQNISISAQTCANGTLISLNENSFPQTCVTTNGVDGTSDNETFFHDFATKTASGYIAGADGINDVQITMLTACNNNSTNNTTTAGACLGPNGIDSQQSIPFLSTNEPFASDFAGSMFHDAPCSNCWVIIEYEFVNGFTSIAGGFDIDWSSMNGPTRGLEMWGGWIEGNFTIPLVDLNLLDTYCYAEISSGIQMMQYLTGVGVGGTLPIGVFGADEITGDGVATPCPDESPGNGQGGDSSVSTGMGDGVISPNWGLLSNNTISKLTMIYLVSNSNGDDCDGDGFTTVNTSPGGSLSFVHMCPPLCPSMNSLIGVDSICEGSTLSLTTSLQNMAIVENNYLDYGIDYVLFNGSNIPPDPYSGGSIINSIPFNELIGDTSALAVDIGGNLDPGEYTICSILNPNADQPIDCSPFICKTFEVYTTLEITCPGATIPPGCNPIVPAADINATSVIGGFDPVITVEDILEISGCIHTVTRIYTATDLFCDIATCEEIFIFTVDIDGPIINLPYDIIVNLDPGLCEAIVNWDVSVEDVCGAANLDLISNPLYNTGATFNKNDSPFIISYQSEDECENISTNSFTITVLEYPEPLPFVSCNDFVQVTLDQNCEITVGADLLLEGGPYGCYDDYIISKLAYNDEDAPVIDDGPMPLLNADAIGDTLTFKIFDPEFGTSCLSQLIIEDKTDPLIFCPCQTDPTDCVYACTDIFDILSGSNPGPQATASDACTNNLSPSYTDEIIQDGGDCGTTIITRSYSISDESGNTAECAIDITFEPVSFDMVVMPQNWNGLNGNPEPLDCANANTDPSNTGVPTINLVPLYDVITNQPNSTCGITATYSDEVLSIYGLETTGTYNILRTWTIVEWCEGSQPTNHIQIIKVADHTPPSFNNCPDHMIIPVDNYTCTGTVVIPNIIPEDDCSGAVYTIATSAGDLDLETLELSNLTIGTHAVTIIAVDLCGNSDTTTLDGNPAYSLCSFEITVMDGIEPIIACDAHTFVPITDEPIVEIEAISFDDGSYDFCGDVSFLARRMGNNCSPQTPYMPTLSFSCCDVGSIVMVELQVTDEANNSGTCMVEVEVQDLLDPTIEAPDDIDLDCTVENPTDNSNWISQNSNDGPPTYENNIFVGYYTGLVDDNCEVTRVDYNISGSVTNCGMGSYTLCFTATDANQRTSSQDCMTIAIDNNDPFEASDIFWPLDYTTTSCGLGLDPESLFFPYDKPSITENSCSWIAIAHQDLEVEVQAPGCLKILRTWTIIDECLFDPSDPDFISGTQPGEDDFIPGYYTYVQQITVENSDVPVITASCDNRFFCNTGSGCVMALADDLIMTATDDCTATDELNISYTIDLNSNGNFGTSFNNTTANGNYPFGTHTIRWVIADGCGNDTDCEYQFTIYDCTPPTPYAHNGLAVDLDQNGTAIFDASNLDAGSFDDCDDNNGDGITDDDLGICDMRIASPSLGQGQDLNNPPLASSWVFDCNDFNNGNNGTTTVDFWIMDCAGNWAYTSTYVLVEDNNTPTACPTSSAMIYGDITTEEGEQIEDVTVNIMQGTPGIPSTQVTGVAGNFEFGELNMGGNYEVEPVKNINPDNGISTFDLVLLSQHILGIEILDSPYKMIAADINHSNTITTFDMVELRKLILFIDDEFQNNSSWRFVNASFEFPDLSNPFATAFPELIDIAELNTDIAANFIGVKIGDLNNSVESSQLIGSSKRNMVEDFVFQVEDKTLIKGEEHILNFTAKDFNDLLGFQFTLDYDESILEFIELSPNVPAISINNFGIKSDQGIITSSWNKINHLEFDNNVVLFSLTFKALNDVTLSEAVIINSRFTKAEAYNLEAEFLNVAIEFTNKNGNPNTNNPFKLYQNTPNPFKNETIIGFNLNEATSAVLSIFDVSGKILKVIKAKYDKGYNEVSINKSDVANLGVLYYTLETSKNTASKRMIILE